jgi:hypothetical protein
LLVLIGNSLQSSMPVWPAYPRAAEVPAKRTGEIGEGLRSWIETEQEQQGEIEEVWDQTWGAGQRRTLLLSSFCFPLSSEESRWADGGESEGSGETASRVGGWDGKGKVGEVNKKTRGRAQRRWRWVGSQLRRREARSDAMTVLTPAIGPSYLTSELSWARSWNCRLFTIRFIVCATTQKNVFKN